MLQTGLHRLRLLRREPRPPVVQNPPELKERGKGAGFAVSGAAVSGLAFGQADGLLSCAPKCFTTSNGTTPGHGLVRHSTLQQPILQLLDHGLGDLTSNQRVVNCRPSGVGAPIKGRAEL